MNFTVEKIEGEYYVSDNGDMYGPFNTYKEATNFMEEQIGLLYEHGAMSEMADDNHYRE
jgi:hypothetical protein